MLGLGDIVIPGIFISLALRYDFSSHVTRTLKRDPDATPSHKDAYAKPYFFAVLIAYVAGLTTTVTIMHTFKAAQPALLYLCPACSKSQRVICTDAISATDKLSCFSTLGNGQSDPSFCSEQLEANWPCSGNGKTRS